MTIPDRFHRQKLLPFVGAEGQARLARGFAVVVGCGAVGGEAAEGLVRAGVGRVRVIDRDVVEWTNLQRQRLFDEADAREGLPKAEAAKRRLLAIRSEAVIEAVVADVSARTAAALCLAPERPGVILDGTDNYETRYLLNDLAVRENVALVYAGAVAGEAMSMTVLPGVTPCLACVFPEPPEVSARRTCDTSGVFGPAVSVAGAWQAGEALKILVGRTDLLSGRLAQVDLERGTARATALGAAPDPACRCCGRREFVWLDRQDESTTTLCGRSSVQVAAAPGAGVIELESVATRLRSTCDVVVNRFLLRASLKSERGEGGASVELTLFRDGRAIVSGVTDAARARSIVARYVGA